MCTAAGIVSLSNPRRQDAGRGGGDLTEIFKGVGRAKDGDRENPASLTLITP
jgi:hypothetical protein